MGNVKCPVSQAQIDEALFENHIKRRYPDWLNTDLVQKVLKYIESRKIETPKEEMTTIKSKKEEIIDEIKDEEEIVKITIDESSFEDIIEDPVEEVKAPSKKKKGKKQK